MAIIANYPALPAAASHTGQVAFVEHGFGTEYTPTYKPAGVYYSTGTVWEYLGSIPLSADAGGILVPGSFVVGEVPTGLVNGSNATFTTAFAFIPESVEVKINGLTQKKVTHYNTSGTTTILFTDSPTTGEIILVNYIKA